ncbi:hypothetical protein BGZ96_005537 [Linnemannia gamsii]|uniref:C3H1-type domain-containing protein n=1 Tax=Linnemannia gamsii TaxID=64522 RepID=A0ABQ7K4L3_9FUNG|nr:hypothetical protein BGZ96_005537 [Linnemannia gamsii]
MSNPVQVDAPFLDRLIHLGSSACLDLHVHGDSESTDTDKALSVSGLTSLSSSTTTTTTTATDTPNTSEVKKGFQPKRKYYLEGRIMHKRKLSRKLFFLDICLVRTRHKSEFSKDIAVGQGGASGSEAPAGENTTESDWEYVEALTSDPSGAEQPQTIHCQRRMEVIARFPTHTLKELDDLWRRVQLGSVVRVYGDIEISEKRKITASEKHITTQWSALLHCLDFDILELWRGKDAFEPNPGSAEISNGITTAQNAAALKSSGKKRKSSEMLEGLSASQQQRGDDSQPHCKFWLNSGKCSKEVCEFWHETDPAKLKAERKRWVDERIQAKRQISHHSSDPHQKTTKNQHRERALYFAKWLIDTFTRQFLDAGSGVLDIAGGRGDLSWELQTRQGIRSTVVEPRPGKGMRKWQRKWLEKFNASCNLNTSVVGSEASTMHEGDEFSTLTPTITNATEEQEPDADKPLDGLADFIPTVKTQLLQATEPARIQAMLDDQFLETHKDLVSTASIIIGLHPDQATEPIVRAALKAGKPFAIIPCCVFSRDNLHRRLPKDLETEDIIISNSSSSSANGGINQAESEEEADSSTRPVTSYADFVTWLETLHPGIKTTWLNFEGMNRVLYWEGLIDTEKP